MTLLETTLTHTTWHPATALERRDETPAFADHFQPSPLYASAKAHATRTERVLASLSEILTLLDHPAVMAQLKGTHSRGGFHLTPMDGFAPAEITAKLAYTKLETLRLKVAASHRNRALLNSLPFSAHEEINILQAIRREASAYLQSAPDDATFHELKNLCQLALGNLQQLTLAASRMAH
jgi:hypothetical protein